MFRDKNVSKMFRNVFDKARAGALRATADGISGNPILRADITLSAVPQTAKSFYKYEKFPATSKEIAGIFHLLDAIRLFHNHFNALLANLDDGDRARL